MYMMFNIRDYSLFLGKFMMDAEVFDIRNRDVILGLSWLIDNGFLVNT